MLRQRAERALIREMRIENFAFLTTLALGAAGLASAQNDECTGALPITTNNPVVFDTTGSTTSAPAWPCASGGSDIWYSYTPSANVLATLETCSSAYDTALEVFSGDCNNLASVICNDDLCGLQSSVVFNATAGATYFIRVGGFNAAFGTGTLTLSESGAPPPPPPIGNSCVQTLQASNNNGAVGGAVYFDLTVTQAVVINGAFVNTSTISAIGLQMWIIPGTYVGNATNGGAGWTQVGDGMGTGVGVNQNSYVAFNVPANLAAGTYGVALIGVGMAHYYTNGTGTNQNYRSPDGVLSIVAGAADNVPWSGAAFSPRVFNGTLCHGSGGTPTVGVNYCTANANSTGQTGRITGLGSASVAANNLTLEASQLPNDSFGLFLTSSTTGFTPMPGGSQGNLCLSGTIGLWVGTGQIKNTAGTGAFDLLIDLAQVPTPSGPVAVMAGDTRSFQAWHRDVVGGTPVSNFSNGLTVTFTN
jgi:hypothetical protein